MSSITFDTLAYSKKLRAVGVPEKQADVQAETFAEIIEDRIATSQYILSLKRDIQEMEMRLKRDIKDVELKLTIKLGTIQAASIVIVAALVKLL